MYQCFSESKYKECAVAQSILDIIESYLDEKGVEIDNEDKQDAIASGQDPDELCVLYGSEYYELEDRIAEVLASAYSTTKVDPTPTVDCTVSEDLLETAAPKADISGPRYPDTIDYIRLA